MERSILELFCQIVEAGSFAQAAHILRMHQMRLELLFSRVERELGVCLADTHAGEIRLNRTGERFYTKVRQALREIADAEAEAQAQRPQLEGVLHLALAEIPPEFFRLVLQFARECPGVNLRLLPRKADWAQADFFLHGDLATPSPKFRRLPLCQEEMLLAVSAAHPWAQREEIPAALLRGAAFFLPDPGLYSFSECARAFLKPLGAMLTGWAPALETLYGFVREGAGFSLCPAGAADSLRGRGIALLPIREPAPVQSYSLSWRKDVPLSPAAHRFLHRIFTRQRKGEKGKRARKAVRSFPIQSTLHKAACICLSLFRKFEYANPRCERSAPGVFSIKKEGALLRLPLGRPGRPIPLISLLPIVMRRCAFRRFPFAAPQ